jgi:hypothetical protein
MVVQEQAHAHDSGGTNLATDTCPLCGSKISRQEFLRVQKIRAEVEVKSRQEISRITALKDHEREAAVAAADASVRNELREGFAREISDALRTQRDEIEQSHQGQLLTNDAQRKSLEEKAAELEAEVVALSDRNKREAIETAEKLASVVRERDKALQNARALEAGQAQTRAKIEAEIRQAYETNTKALQEAADGARSQTASAEQALKELQEQLDRQAKAAQAAKIAEMQQQRETLERERKLELYEKDQEQARERDRWFKKIADLEKQVQNKSANELGDATQFHVLEALRNAFPDDRVTPIPKGKPGADIRHEVLVKGIACGKILVDAKNHKQWRNDFVTKLKEDQRAEHAEYAIVATTEFPSGKKILCIEEEIVVTTPAQIVGVIGILRRALLQMHTLRLTANEREKKTQKVYAFITSEPFRQQMGKVEEVATKLGDLDVEEQQAHQRVWKKRGQLVVSLNEAHAKIEGEIGAIIED